MLWPWFILVTLYGCCIGSFLNVVIYRLPEGKSLWRPGSMCPRCGHALAWYDNIPVLGWLLLHGRCRYCRSAISIQYPVVEALTGSLFAGMFWLCYQSGWRPDFQYFHGAGRDAFLNTWPVFLAYLVLVAGLLGATVIDARLYIIPLEIPVTVIGLTLVTYALGTIGVAGSHNLCPTVPLRFWGAVAGASAGLTIALVLRHFELIPLSFEELLDGPYEDASGGQPSEHASLASDAPTSAPDTRIARRTRIITLAILGVILAAVVIWVSGNALAGAIALVALWLCVILVGLLDEERMSVEEAEEMIAHPSPRREVLKELLFVGWPVVGAFLGYALLPASWGRGLASPYKEAIEVMLGVAAGYLIGATIVWTTRILGTLSFGREAMGLGDVHLLAAIGAVLGWQSTVMIFFIAPFIGLTAALVAYGLSRMVKGQVRVIPYGPYIASAAVVYIVFHEPLMRFAGILFGQQ